MNILAVDTATSSLSVALLADDNLVWEQTLSTGESHSKHLQGVIQGIFEKSKLEISQIDGFAVSCGPGSFTGLRIGVSAVKGLASANNKPVVSISALDALAYPFSCSGRMVCPVIDARRGEVYYAFYTFQDGTIKNKSEEKVATPEDVLKSASSETIFVGSGVSAYASLFAEPVKTGALIAPVEMNVIRSGVIARIASARFKTNDIDDLCRFKPHYIRKSDAELNFRG